MPRETVRDVAGMYDAHIGWSAGQYVQVGMTTADHQPLIDNILRLVPDASDDAGQEKRVREVREARARLAELVGDDTLGDFTGVWGTLDREGCNRLIRILRKARDQAFGKDE